MVITMNKCKEYQMMIPDFHKETLNYKDELMFLDHVADCEDCREEMEIYYIIEYGLNDSEEKDVNPKYRKYLNVFDFKGMVEQHIKQSILWSSRPDQQRGNSYKCIIRLSKYNVQVS